MSKEKATGSYIRSEGNHSIQARLNEELESLAVKMGMNERLDVVWLPDWATGLEGEVRGKTIFIYTSDPEKVVSILRHEFLDYCLTSKIVKPLVDLVNLLIKSRETEIYREKEKLVESLLGLFS